LKNIFFAASIVVAAGILAASCAEAPKPPGTVEAGVDLYAEAPMIRVGYVKQDHHSALFVAALRGEEMRERYPVYLAHLGEDYYALVKDGSKVAEIQVVQSGGAMEVPNNMLAGVFDIGFGGVAAFASAADRETGIRIIAPLHYDGDMLVVAADNHEVSDWDSFVEWVMGSEMPVTVAFKFPTAVAVVLLEGALNHSGVPYSYASNPQAGSRVLLFNAQGEANLNPSLSEGTIQAYVSNNPHPAIAEHNGIGKVVCSLSDLPPGIFGSHPCCALAATSGIIESNPDEVAAILELFVYATDYINNHREDAAEAVSQWCGVPYEVTLVSMATSTYDMELNQTFRDNMHIILNHMRSLGVFTGPLAGQDRAAVEGVLYDFSMIGH
jgi:ABC-type nitrate/sulfonate/bicarbonate transport system substrate-binding protein